MYTILATLPDGSRYQVACNVLDENLEIVLNKLKRSHVYRYARFDFYLEGNNDE